MKRFAALAGATILALMATACNQTANTHDAEVQAIKDVETQWNQDYVAKDMDKLVGHYADDAVLMAPGGPAAVGKDAIRSALKQMVADPTMTLKFQATKVDTSSAGDMGYSQGTYTLTLTDPQSKQLIHDNGNYVTVYSKGADGTWKAVSDIASSAVPPPPAAKKH